MPFSIQCNNKGCGKLQEPYLEKQSDKVFCSLCDKEISNATYFAKVQMKTLKQFKPENKSFSVKCIKCGKESQPKLQQQEIICGICGQSMSNLSIPFRNMLKEKLKEANKDVE